MLVYEVVASVEVGDESEVDEVESVDDVAAVESGVDEEGDDDEELLAWRKTAGFGFEAAAAPAGREKVVPLQQPVFWSIAVSQQ